MKKFIVWIFVLGFIMTLITGCGEQITSKNTTIEATLLTDDELAYFNGDSFFNGQYLNIRNQFLSSLYNEPADVDLFGLFYCSSGIAETITEDELTVVMAKSGMEGSIENLPCPCEKISRSNMDEILKEYMDLTLADTNKIGLENFVYLQEYDAYYFFHGDTNYRGNIKFSSGERKGDVIRLFYDDEFFGDGRKVLTLQEKDGAYLFVSNQKSESEATDESQHSNGNESTGIKPEETVSETITDTGRYLGQVDSNFIEVQISGVPDDLNPMVFMLSDDVKDGLESADFLVDDNIKLEYYINENNQKVITSIQKI